MRNQVTASSAHCDKPNTPNAVSSLDLTTRQGYEPTVHSRPCRLVSAGPWLRRTNHLHLRKTACELRPLLARQHSADRRRQRPHRYAAGNLGLKQAMFRIATRVDFATCFCGLNEDAVGAQCLSGDALLGMLHLTV